MRVQYAAGLGSFESSHPAAWDIPFASPMILTPELVPILSAPASIMITESFTVFTPPLALTFKFRPTTLFISLTFS